MFLAEKMETTSLTGRDRLRRLYCAYIPPFRAKINIHAHIFNSFLNKIVFKSNVSIHLYCYVSSLAKKSQGETLTGVKVHQHVVYKVGQGLSRQRGIRDA